MKELGAETSKQPPSMQPKKRAMNPELEMEKHHVPDRGTLGKKGKSSFMGAPSLNPGFSRHPTSFIVTRREVLDVDDRLMKKIYELLDDMKSCKCNAFVSHFCDALKIMFSGYKALIMFGLCSLLVVWQDELQDQLVHQRNNADDKSFFKGQHWFLLIIILVFVMKALTAPSSKSFITFSLTVLYYLNLKNTVSQCLLFQNMIGIILNLWNPVIDWILDFTISTSQVHFACAKFSRSLFLLLYAILFASIINPIFFVAVFVFRVAYYFPGGEDFMIRFLWCSPFAILSIVYTLCKLHRPCFSYLEGLSIVKDREVYLIAKFMLMLDSIFLVLYSWFRYYGRFITNAVIASFVIMIQWLNANAKSARSSEGQNHDRHASQHKKMATRNECRKWTDSAAARCSDGQNHDTTVLRSISSDLLDCMSNYKLPLLVVLLMIFYPDQCSIFTTNIIFVTVILSILPICIFKIIRLEKELSRLKSKQPEIDSLRAKVEILEKNPRQNIFGPGSKQVNVVVEIEGSTEKITNSLPARSASEALVGISDQQSLTDKPQLYNKNFGIDREEYEKIPVLPSIPL